jgi:hypothetical protein
MNNAIAPALKKIVVDQAQRQYEYNLAGNVWLPVKDKAHHKSLIENGYTIKRKA